MLSFPSAAGLNRMCRDYHSLLWEGNGMRYPWDHRGQRTVGMPCEQFPFLLLKAHEMSVLGAHQETGA